VVKVIRMRQILLELAPQNRPELIAGVRPPNGGPDSREVQVPPPQSANAGLSKSSLPDLRDAAPN